MSKLYCHTPVKRIVRDFISHLDIPDKNKGSIEELDQDFTALILSPISETKSFRQVFPLFIKRLSKKFKSFLKKQDITKKATISWDEGLVIVLESLEDFLNLRWQVKFHRLEACNDSPVDNFKEPIATQGISDEIFVSFQLLTQKKENTFEFNEVEGAVHEIEVDDNDEENAELVVEEIAREKTEEDKEKERIRQEEEDKRLEKEFQEFKKTLDERIEDLDKMRKSYQFRSFFATGETILSSLSTVKSSKREHAIYLTGKKIDVSVMLSTVNLGNGSSDKVVKLLQPLVPVAKKGPVDVYVDLLILLGDAQFQLDDYEDAMKCYSMALGTKKKFTKEHKMTINAKRAKTAICFEEDDGIGYVNMTAEEGFKYMKYVTENTKPGEGLYSYAACALADTMFKKGQIGQAAHTCLIALVADSTNEELRRLFVSFLQKHDQLVTAILDMFTNINMPEGNEGEDSTASSISFIGNILKENSAITQAEIFIKKGCELSNYKEPDLVWTHLHLLELQRDFPRYVLFAMQYLKKTRSKGVSFEIGTGTLETSPGLKPLLDELLAENKYDGYIKKVETGFRYKVSNGLMATLLSNANEIIETFLSTSDIRFDEREYGKNPNVVISSNALDSKNEEKKDQSFTFLQKFVTISVNGETSKLSQLTQLLAKSDVCQSVEFDQKSLQILSIYFSMIKVLYQVAPIPQPTFARAHGKNIIPELLPLLEIIEPIRMVAKDLHLTPARNEQASYTSIALVLQSKLDNRAQLADVLVKTPAFEYHQERVAEELKKVNPDFAAEKDYKTLVEDTLDKIYVFGDTHCFSLAWQVINKKDFSDSDFDAAKDFNPVEFLPVLVSGVKAWYLREESTFYPKYAFFEGARYIQRHLKNTIKRQEYLFNNGNELNRTEEELAVIRASKPKVLLLFGDIDCREGMSLALETGKYNSLEEAAASVVEMYLTAISKLLKKYDFKCYVHPVLPVYETTSSLVTTFNKTLKEKVLTLKKSLKDDSNLVYLDFLDKITNEKGLVRQELLIDGIHAHPDYAHAFKEQLLD